MLPANENRLEKIKNYSFYSTLLNANSWFF